VGAGADGLKGLTRKSLREKTCALVAQLDRASDFESEGREFESLRARQDLGANKGLLSVSASFYVPIPCCKTLRADTREINGLLSATNHSAQHGRNMVGSPSVPD
jgi:hypothetical protein